MSHRPETTARLRAQGLRVTPQRLVILDVLQHSERHLGADEIFTQVQARFPTTDISTVYRTLETLVGLGMVQKVTLGESHDLFEWTDAPHHHFVCQSCGAVMHFGDEFLDQMKTMLASRYRFQVTRAYLEVFGICEDCAASS